MKTKQNQTRIRKSLKENNLTYTSLETYGTCPQCEWLIG